MLLLAVLSLPSVACRWDRDTLRDESPDAENVIRTITGRFVRYPDRYYEMRLERVSKEIAKTPENLDLYDDAGVAADRLHLGDQAIEWMVKKKKEIDRQGLPENHNHRYRYHANLGTIIFHQWMREELPTEKIVDAEEGINHIAKAIQINPDAHFGREKYQLMAMNWVVELASGKPAFREDELRSFVPLGNMGYLLPEKSNAFDSEDATTGIAGLIELGDAWQSVDIFYALTLVLLNRELGHVAYLSEQRTKELLDEGKQSLAGTKFIEYSNSAQSILRPRKQQIAEVFYQKARKEADRWQQARWDYMDSRFADGDHPDTNPNFWDDFSYSGKPPSPPRYISAFYIAIFTIVFWIAAIILTIVLWRFWKRRRSAKWAK